MNKKINTANKKIYDEILELKKNLLNFSFQKYSGQLEKTSQIKETRRKIAKLKFDMSKNNGDKNA
jgi:ribosomal protein L29